jgi:hypothetical protein
MLVCSAIWTLFMWDTLFGTRDTIFANHATYLNKKAKTKNCQNKTENAVFNVWLTSRPAPPRWTFCSGIFWGYNILIKAISKFYNWPYKGHGWRWRCRDELIQCLISREGAICCKSFKSPHFLPVSTKYFFRSSFYFVVVGTSSFLFKVLFHHAW